MQNDDFIDENLDNAGSASDNNTVHKNLDLDVVLAEITAFAENMHTKNQHKKKNLLKMHDDNSLSIHGTYVYHGYRQGCLSSSLGNFAFYFLCLSYNY